MKSKSTAVAIAAGLMIFGLATPQASGAKTPAAKPGMALFSSFRYDGSDDYYAANPLPDESSYYNPILPGWYSDPSICTNGEGDYFLATSTFTYFPGVPLFHSRDLINWRQVGHILSRPSQLINMDHQHVSGGIFAPDIKYCKANKTYYMITTNVGAGNFFVKTQDPFGEWSDPIALPEVAGIDPSFFFDEDGKAYIVNNDDAPDNKPEYPGHRTVRVVEFDINADKCVGERKIVINKGCRSEEKPIWCEGPHIYNIGGVYYLMTAEGGTSDWHSEVIYRGSSPFGPYEAYAGNPILTQRTLDKNRPYPITCAGHADLVQTKEGDWWGVFLAVRPVENNQENLGRETFMLPVEWTGDGWPVMTRENEIVSMIGSRPGTKRGENVTFGNFSRYYDFNWDTLHQDWMTLRGPVEEYYSFTEVPGNLCIKCAEVATSEKNPVPMVLTRLYHRDFSVATTMTFVPSKENETAGMAFMKDETHQYLLSRTCDKGRHYVTLTKVGENGNEVIGSHELKKKKNVTIDMKIEGKGLDLAFYCSEDGGKNWQEVASKVDGGYTSTGRAGGFTGTTVGLYATSKR